MSEVRQENKMGTRPIGPLLFSMAAPMVLSMLVQALYNIVDSIFVARVGEDALTAVSLSFPIQNLMIAFATGTGVGINALLSRSLGEKNFDQADRAANTGILLAVITFAAFALFGLFGTEIFFGFLTRDAQIALYGTQYLRVVTIFSFGLFLEITFERLLQSTGLSLFSMFTQGTGAITNIILDPILIFGLFGFPKMGVTGAAVATVIGQIAGMTLGIIFNLRVNKELHIGGKHLKLHGPPAAAIYQVGVPSIIMASIGSVMNFFLNKILLGFSSTAAAVFGVYFKLQSFVFMPVFGLNNGMVPIIAYNYGARNKERIYKTIRISMIAAVCIMLLGLAAFQLIPGPLLRLFDASENMMEIGIPAFRTISLSFIFAGICVIAGSVFQALGNGFYSLLNSIIRQLVVIVPVSWLLAHFFGLHAVWWAFPIAEITSITLSSLLLRKILREKVDVL